MKYINKDLIRVFMDYFTSVVIILLLISGYPCSYFVKALSGYLGLLIEKEIVVPFALCLTFSFILHAGMLLRINFFRSLFLAIFIMTFLLNMWVSRQTGIGVCSFDMIAFLFLVPYFSLFHGRTYFKVKR